MKKIALTSLLAALAVSGAHAANTIDGNPLYMPKAGHFYSVTSLESHTKNETPWTLAEDFGYGISDKLAVEVSTSLTENDVFDNVAWNNVALKATFRALDMGAWKADVYGGVNVSGNPDAWLIPGGGLYVHSKAADVNEWFNEDLTGYAWTAGVRGGYTTAQFTVAGHVAYNYMNSEMFNWGDKGLRTLSLGLDGQFVINNSLNLVAGVEYTGIINDHMAYDDLESPLKTKNEGTWTGMFGVNYNIDATKFVGAYINGSMHHHGGTNADEWEWNDGFGFGVKFGIDF